MSKQKVACGIHAVCRAIKDVPEQIEAVWIATNHKNPRVAACAAHAKKANVQVRKATPDEMDQMAGQVRHQGVLATLDAVNKQVHLKDFLAELPENPDPCCLVAIDGISDPHNLGACMRSAEAFGACGLLLPKARGVQLTPTVSKVACGAAERLPIFRETNLARALRSCQEAGFWVIGASLEATKAPRQTDFKRPCVLVLGSEALGMRQLTQNNCDENVKIPLNGATESLNVSVACGVLMYEIAEQQKR